MKDLIQIGKQKKGYFLLALATTLILGTTRGFIPIIVQYIVDTILGDLEPSIPKWLVEIIYRDTIFMHLFLAASTIAIVALMRGIVMVINAFFKAKFSEGIAEYLRNKMYHHINRLSYSYHNDADTGDLIQRSTTDIDTIRMFFAEHIHSLIWISSMSITVIIQMLLMNVYLTLVSIVVIPITVGLSVYFFRIIKDVFTKVEESESALTTTVQENLNGVRVVKAFNREAYEIEKFREKNEGYRLETLRLYDYMANYWSSSDAITMIQYAITLSIGVTFQVNGMITVGQTLAFVMLVQIIIWPIRNLGRIVSEYSKTMVSIKRINDVLDVEDEYVEDGTVEPAIKGDISFKHVSFRFEDSTESLLEDVSFEIKQGETIALIGRTGSGKSTLIKLLARLLNHQSGEILIDGVPIEHYPKRYLRKNVGVILQEPFLYSRTVEENIGITMTSKNKERIEVAANMAAISNDIDKFEQGYDTLVGEKGVTLSGGQKQRVAIARALIDHHPIMVFDDSLSALDTETDLAIRKALQETNRQTSTIIITHRITTAMEADRIMILEHGRIVENDTHEALLQKEGLYKRLYDIQTGLEQTTTGGEINE